MRYKIVELERRVCTEPRLKSSKKKVNHNEHERLGEDLENQVLLAQRKYQPKDKTTRAKNEEEQRKKCKSEASKLWKTDLPNTEANWRKLKLIEE